MVESVSFFSTVSAGSGIWFLRLREKFLEGFREEIPGIPVMQMGWL